jgi:hypothetical protein
MRHNPIVIIGGVIVILLIGVAITAGVWSEHANEQTRTCTVTDKDRTTVSTRDTSRSDMRIYTADCGTLAVADLMTRGQFESADMYASIEPGKTYEITTVGWRIGWLSAFPTVLGTPVEVNR